MFRLAHSANARSRALFVSACCWTTLGTAHSGAAQSGVVINEFRYDDAGASDDREFVELFNAGSQPVDLSGWVLDASDSGLPADNPDYTIAPNTILAPGAYWVLGSAAVVGVDQVLTNPGTGLDRDLFENDTESLTLRDVQGQIVDTVVYEGRRGVWDRTLVEGEPIWGDHDSRDGGGATSLARLRDGWDTDDNGRDFRLAPSTPGSSNQLSSNRRLSTDFDGGQRGATVAGFAGSHGELRIIDPQIADNLNPSAIPASPQGGLAAVLTHAPDDGTVTTWLTDVADDFGIEAQVWLDATLCPPGGRRSWAIGLRGSSDARFAHPDPGRRGPAPSANGNTGVAWNYVVDDQQAVLYLVDHGSGGNLHLILARIRIQPGINDGWQPIRLISSGGRAHGSFGLNAVGASTDLPSHVRDGYGGVWIGARQTGPGTQSPLRFDQLLTQRDTLTRTASGGSGCTGNCPTKNSKPESVDTEAGESIPPGEYAFRIDYDPAEPYTITQLCFWTSRFLDGPTSLPTVSILPLNGAGTGPDPVPLFTYALSPPPDPPEDVESWWATAPFPAFVPTEDFFISFEHLPFTHGVHAPIGTEGDPLQAWHRPTTGTGPFSAVTEDRRWAWALVCPDDTATVDATELTPALIGGDFRVGLGGGRPLSAAVLTFGFSTQSWNGVPLPFDLGFLGAPTCQIQNSIAITVGAVTNLSGNAAVSMPLPPTPGLAGVSFHQQWLVFDANANQLGVTISPPLSTRIGRFR